MAEWEYLAKFFEGGWMMAKTNIKTQISITMFLELTEDEARALDALAGYGDESFLDVFYNKLGRHYLEPHEIGLRSLFSVIRREIPGKLKDVDRVRELFMRSKNNVS